MKESENSNILINHAKRITSFEDIFDVVDDFPRKRLAVAVAEHVSVLEAIRNAEARGLVDAILVGDRAKITQAADEVGYELAPERVVHVPRPTVAAAEAVRMVHDNEADIIMKGHLHSDDFLRAVLNRDKGLRTRAVMSHVFVWESLKEFGRLVFVTDAAMNIAPSLETKADIILNAVHLAGMFGVHEPRVAVMAAVELINPKMPATLEAGSLAKMCSRRQYSPKFKLDGPLALDNALSEQAAITKGIKSEVAGNADVLVVPDIEAGNMLAKSFRYLTGGRMAGMVVGAAAPVVLTSRADSPEDKLYSIAGAVLMSAFERDLELKIGKVHY